MQFIKGRVDEATGRQEEDEIVWVDELARVKLDGSGEVLEVPLADCFVFNAQGNRYPAAKKWKPRYAVPKSDDWAPEQWEQEIADMMVFCHYEIMEEFGRKPGPDGEWNDEDIAFLEKVCRERCPGTAGTLGPDRASPVSYPPISRLAGRHAGCFHSPGGGETGGRFQ